MAAKPSDSQVDFIYDDDAGNSLLINSISEEEFQKVVDLINNRPRRCLGWKTPAEVYSESVALG